MPIPLANWKDLIGMDLIFLVVDLNKTIAGQLVGTTPKRIRIMTLDGKEMKFDKTFIQVFEYDETIYQSLKNITTEIVKYQEMIRDFIRLNSIKAVTK